MPICWRPMRPKDVDACVEIVVSHPVIGSRYGQSITDLAPAWMRLLACESQNATVFENIERSRSAICAVGVSLIVTDEFVRELKAAPLFWFGPELARRLTRGYSPLVSNKQLRELNTCGGLNLLVWEGCFHRNFESSAEAHRAMMTAFIEQHRGFLWKELFSPQVESVERLEWTLKTGTLLWDPATSQYGDASPFSPNHIVRHPHLVGLSRDVEIMRLSSWGGQCSWVGSLFEYSPPRCGFSPSEQQLLISAVRGGTDQELANALRIAVPTVKKLWVSIYDRASTCLLDVIPNSYRTDDVAQRGPEKRRRLLAYLRNHPEELRPISRKILQQRRARASRRPWTATNLVESGRGGPLTSKEAKNPTAATLR